MKRQNRCWRSAPTAPGRGVGAVRQQLLGEVLARANSSWERYWRSLRQQCANVGTRALPESLYSCYSGTPRHTESVRTAPCTGPAPNCANGGRPIGTRCQCTWDPLPHARASPSHANREAAQNHPVRSAAGRLKSKLSMIICVVHSLRQSNAHPSDARPPRSRSCVPCFQVS